MVKTAWGLAWCILGQAEPSAKRADAMTVLIAVVLLLLVLIGLMILRAGRRMKRQIESESRQPTAVDDIWRMHKLPEDRDDDGTDDDGLGDKDIEEQ